MTVYTSYSLASNILGIPHIDYPPGGHSLLLWNGLVTALNINTEMVPNVT